MQIEGRVLEALPAHIDAIHVRVRSLSTGNLLFATGARRLGIVLEEPGPFRVQLELQANVPTGSYTVEVAAQHLPSQTDVAQAPSVMLRVKDRGIFQGWVQLNPVMTALE